MAKRPTPDENKIKVVKIEFNFKIIKQKKNTIIFSDFDSFRDGSYFGHIIGGRIAVIQWLTHVSNKTKIQIIFQNKYTETSIASTYK